MAGQAPKMKKELAIDWVSDQFKTIHIYATQDALSAVQGFGSVTSKSSDGGATLKVDPRYDFDEVKKYIEDYGK